MPELIDKRETIRLIQDRFCSECYTKGECDGCEYKYCIEAVEDASTIEAEPVRHGEWILIKDQSRVDNDNNNYAYFCSQCHHQDVHSKLAKVNFCWNCGCKMNDGGAENG